MLPETHMYNEPFVQTCQQAPSLHLIT